MSELRVGTSSWTAPSWEAVFYPPGLPQVEWLREYARRFNIPILLPADARSAVGSAR